MSRKFYYGANIPWILFAKDVTYFSSPMEKRMGKIMDEICLSGGNCMRWWIHTNGVSSPEFLNGKVCGLNENSIPIIIKVLDMAFERNISVFACLWSFDMLENQGQDVQAMKNILEKPEYMEHYLEYALRPILRSVGNHPSLASWEIFNEPEGMTNTFGWTFHRTEMKCIQSSINRIAGFIRREGNGIPVSSSAWSMRTLTDTGGYVNHYRDDRLIEAGGDPLGYLDFFQVHFYPEHETIRTSPFHHSSKYWNLEKPILISEVPESGCLHGENMPKKNITDCLEYAYDEGYAGCLTWPNKIPGEISTDVKSAFELLAKKKMPET